MLTQLSYKLMNEACLYANQNCGNDRHGGYYWTEVFTEQYTKLLMSHVNSLLDEFPRSGLVKDITSEMFVKE